MKVNFLEGKRSMLYNFDNKRRICCCSKGGVCSDESDLLIELIRECLIEDEEEQNRRIS